jgi:hypothetical protein
VTVVEHAGFWGAGEPIFVSSLGAMPPLIRNLRFVNISAVSENGALFSSLPLNSTTRGVEGIELTNVNITIKHTGNVTGAPKGKDYSPTRDGFPAIVPAWVSGMSFEGVPAPGNIYVTPLRFKLGGHPFLSARFNVETAGSERNRPEI